MKLTEIKMFPTIKKTFNDIKRCTLVSLLSFTSKNKSLHKKHEFKEITHTDIYTYKYKIGHIFCCKAFRSYRF